MTDHILTPQSAVIGVAAPNVALPVAAVAPGGASEPLNLDASGNLYVNVSSFLPTGITVNEAQTAQSTAAWTNATSQNTALTLNVVGYSTVLLCLNQGSTITQGAVTFEASDSVAGTNWYAVEMVSTNGTYTNNGYALTASTNIAFQMNIQGFVLFRVRLTLAMLGTGTVNVSLAAQASAAEWVQGVFQITNPWVISATTAANGSGNPIYVSSAITGSPTVDIQGHAGAAVDAAPGATAPANGLQVGGVDYNGNFEAFATDTTGKPRVVGATMNPQIVQGSLALGPLTNSGTSTTTLAKAYGSAVKLGNTLVVLVGLSANEVVTITDSLNLQWQTVTVAFTAGAGQTMAFFALVTTAGTPTVTLTAASTDMAMAMYEIEGAGAVDITSQSTTSSTSAAVSATCNVSQPNELGFMCVSAGAQTISAASPVQPASSVFDSGNIVVGGSVLKNFGAFSAQFGYPIDSVSTSGNITNTFKATLGGAVAWGAVAFAFRPAAVQALVTGMGFQGAVPVGGVQAARRGVIWPWAPVAVATTAASMSVLFRQSRGS